MQDKVTAAGDVATVADAVGHGFMTLIADSGAGLHVTVDPPMGRVAWVMHVKSYPVNLSIHLDRAGLELLADRIGQALQDYDLASDESDLTPPDHSEDDGEGGSGEVSSTLAPCPMCGELYDYGAKSGGACTVCAWLMKPVAEDDGVDLDDTDLTSGPEQE